MKVASFYRFADVPDPRPLAAELQAECARRRLLGTLLIAPEGVNGTLAGDTAALDAVLGRLAGALGLAAPMEARWTKAQAAPFRRLRVRVKNEIVALGRPDVLPQRRTGRHVAPRDWNRLMDDPRTLLVDARNRYEVEVGRFPGALDPGTDSFRQFAEFAATLGDADRRRPVAMYCTGGIRCEKASALLLESGFTDVCQLQGGILNYLEQVEPPASRWQGECFVFDSRVAVDRDLAEGGYVQCHACRRPLGPDDLVSPDYREGLSCPHCAGSADEDRLRRLEERRRQVELARARGAAHIGARPPRRRPARC